jgi:NADPH2 dehydrogenase
MASGTADAAGYVTPETIEHYRRLAGSGAGLLLVEYTFVDPVGRSEPNQLGAATDAHLPGLRRLREALRPAGIPVGLQLTHCGGKGSRALAGGKLVAPSAVPVPTRTGPLETPEALPLGEIPAYQEAFLAATDRAVAAGFDLVELHAAHGYGLNQWLSPLTNQRQDRYGGCPENRWRMLLELVRGIRARHPDLALAVRLPGQDLLEGGLTLDETRRLARRLEQEGLTLLDVSSGMGGWRRPRERRGQGYLVAEAAAVQAAVSMPVIGVGGIQEGAWIDDAVERGTISLAAVGRALLEDPSAFRSRVLPLEEVRLLGGEGADVPEAMVA